VVGRFKVGGAEAVTVTATKNAAASAPPARRRAATAK
jgi:hypothetical protein